MNRQEFEQFLYDHIPITEKMGFTVEEFTSTKVKLAAKLEPNTNHKATAFGGSINSLMTVCGWAMVFANIKAVDEEAHIVIQKSNINYKAPIDFDFSAECELYDEAEKERFFQTYQKHNKARLTLKVKCCKENKVFAEYEGQYVVFK
ncbi:YiiD C-terminal domain-containing protein [Clostridium manihotivorum]|uniref:Thioesterase n=1 Tax=Clostridium manihotivorum TaxID=2320868 RepID=A0A410DU03_9CLOT|nr:YiiD C-terminal domain-containing protein [Clostridium manihotivorum]QAA32531.1 thioesterase [Clostridium manihotivorum]